MGTYVLGGIGAFSVLILAIVTIGLDLRGKRREQQTEETESGSDPERTE